MAVATAGDELTFEQVLERLESVTDEALERLLDAWRCAAARPDWDRFWLLVARVYGLRANCTRRKASAIIVRDHRLIAAGYNGAPAGQPGCLEGACPRGLLSYDEVAPLTNYDEGPGKCTAIHAEANAIIHGEYERIRGSTIYMIPGAPCFGCQKLIAGAGLTRAVWPGGEWIPTTGLLT